MPLWTKADFTILEDTDMLVVRVERQRGSLERPIGIALILFAFFSAYEWKSWSWLTLAVIAAIGMLFQLLKEDWTELTVTEKQITARGDLSGTFDSAICLETAEIDSLTYQTGGEDSDSGLYAKHGWTSTCLIPKISETQSNEITAAIFRRFPNIGKEDTAPGSLLFGKQSGIITLGL